MLPGLGGFMVAGLSASAPQIIGSPTQGAQGSSGASTLTRSHTTTSATGCVVVVFTWGRNGDRTVSSVKWNGLTMTLAAGVNDNGGSMCAGVHVYYYNNPTATTANVVATMSGGNVDSMVMQIFNIDRAVTVNTSGISSATISGSKTVSLVMTEPALVLGARAKNRVASSMTAAGDATEVADVQNGTSGSAGTYWFGKIENASGTMTFGASITSTADGDALAAAAFQ